MCFESVKLRSECVDDRVLLEKLPPESVVLSDEVSQAIRAVRQLQENHWLKRSEHLYRATHPVVLQKVRESDDLRSNVVHLGETIVDRLRSRLLRCSNSIESLGRLKDEPSPEAYPGRSCVESVLSMN